MKPPALRSRWAACSGLIFALALVVACAVPATAGPVSVISTSYGPMDGFELYGGGLYYWNNGYPGDETVPQRLGQIGSIAVLGGNFYNLTGSRSHLFLQSPGLFAPEGAVVRTDQYLFSFVRDSLLASRIYRRPLFGMTNADLGIDFGGVSYNDVGAMLVEGAVLYWADVQGNTTEIRSKPVSAGPGGGDTIELSINGVGRVRKMLAVDIQESEGRGPIETDLVFLTQTGRLYRYKIAPYHEDLSLVAVNVSDFAARDESYLVPSPPPLAPERVYETRIYATTGIDVSSSRPPGSLVVFNLSTGGSYVTYQTGSPDVQLTSVAMDDTRVFLTRTPVRFDGVVGGLGGWVLDPANAVVIRTNIPATTGLITFPGTNDTIVTLEEGRNLRVDGAWLYYLHQNHVRKVKTDAPAVQLDYRAVGLEAIQAVQDFNNSVPLIAGKPTLVRGYAQRVVNGSSLPKFPLHASLRGFRDGAELHPSPLFDNHTRVVDAYDDLAVLRTDLNRSFLFQLPDEWMSQPGTLHLEFTVNPGLTAPETPGDPLANNTAMADVTVLPGREPCLVFKAMSSTYPNYDASAPGSGFGDILDRALTLMPVSNFRTFFNSGSVTKPVFLLEPFPLPHWEVKQRSFSMPDDKYWALLWLTVAHATSGDPDGCPDCHWVGMFPPEDKPFNGIGGARGVKLSDLVDGLPIDFEIPAFVLDDTLVVRMSAGQGNADNPWGTIAGGHTLAHELGHNYGRFHIDQTRSPGHCYGQTPDRPWQVLPNDGDPCNLGVINLHDAAAPIGFDWRTSALVLPYMAADLMTYANSDWISPFTWNALANAIPVTSASARPLPAANPTDPIYLVQGMIQNSTAVLLPVLTLPVGAMDPAKVQASLAASAALPANYPYRLRLVGNPNAAPLDERPLVVLPAGDGISNALAFVQAVPQIAGTTRIQLLGGNSILAEISASPHAPQLDLVPPRFNPAAKTLSCEWTAGDADGDMPLFTVQFSADDGAKWQTLRVHDPALGLTLSTRELPGGDACRLRVIATDGFNTTLATTPPFALPRHDPMVNFGGVRDQQRVPYGADLAVTALAYDTEDGRLNPAQLQWSLSGQENRTRTGGSSFPLRGLSPGGYSLSCSTVDSDGNAGNSSVSFEILPIAFPDGPAPILDGTATDDEYINTPAVTFSTDSPDPSVRFIHANGNLYVCWTGLPMSDAGANPASAQVVFDLDVSRDLSARTGDVGFGVDETGAPFQLRGDGTRLAADSLSAGFTVKLSTSLNTWTAEMFIPDALLGGWNHSAGMAVNFVRYQSVGGGSATDPLSNWPPGAQPESPRTWAAVSFGSPPVATNRAPTAVAYAPAVVNLTDPLVVTLDGAASYDPDGDPLTFAWSQVGGPAVTLQNAASATPSFTTPVIAAPVILRFQLMVNDGQVPSAPAEASVTLQPLATVPPPTATSINFNPAGGELALRLAWPATSGDRVVVQASSDLVTWEDLAIDTVGFMQTVIFKDLQIGTHPRRFYRLAAAPLAPPEFVVLNSSDSGFGSLRDTLQRAPENATITFAPFVTGTITLTEGELVINKSLTLLGPGANMLTVSGGDSNRVFNLAGGAVTIAGLTIRDGLISASSRGANGLGGGIFNRATLLLSNCAVLANVAIGSNGLSPLNANGGVGGQGLGGGIYNTGTLALVNCALAFNEARGANGGSGADRNNADSGFNGGGGGQGLGGAVYNDGFLSIANCTIATNRVRGGNGGSGGEGGLFLGRGGNGGGAEGAGVFIRQPCQLSAVTLIGNSAERGSGGPGVPAGAGGITRGGAVSAPSSLAIANTLVALNSLGTGGQANNGPDIFGTIVSQGFNLVGITNGSSAWVASDLTGNNNSPLDPLVGPLQDNGGPTPTIALLLGSPAIDRAKNLGLNADQRGFPRTFDFGAIANALGGDGTDIGAYELSPSGP